MGSTEGEGIGIVDRDALCTQGVPGDGGGIIGTTASRGNHSSHDAPGIISFTCIGDIDMPRCANANGIVTPGEGGNRQGVDGDVIGCRTDGSTAVAIEINNRNTLCPGSVPGDGSGIVGDGASKGDGSPGDGPVVGCFSAFSSIYIACAVVTDNGVATDGGGWQ